MKKTAFTLALSILLLSNAYTQAPDIEWQKSLGGMNAELPYSMQTASDGGYIMAGGSDSNNGDVSGNHGDSDFWIVKMDATGAIQWQKSLGGSGYDHAVSIQSTADDGYIATGASDSNNGDVSGNHGNWDCWVVKLNAAGDIQWQKSLGGTNRDFGASIQPTPDGGYIVAGVSASDDGDVSVNHGFYDYWVVKLNSTGDMEWQKSLGGTGDDYANSIQLAPGGGYIVAGISDSDDGDVSGNHGEEDCWVVKLDAGGNIEWQKSFGGTEGDEAFSILPAADGGYIMAGNAKSDDGDVSGNHGNNDCWIVKMDADGNIQWQKMLGGTQFDEANSIHFTAADGGYIVAGLSDSNDGDVSGNHGDNDFWVVKLDATGAIQWQKSLGGTGGDRAYSIQLSADGGYVVAGDSGSDDGDISGNHGETDYWIVKLGSSAPNNMQWRNTLGGTNDDEARSIQITADGGYIAAGMTASDNGNVSGNHGDIDFWLVKMDATGVVSWQKTLGGTNEEQAYAVVQTTADGGYFTAGFSDSDDGDVSGNHGMEDFWVVRLDATGTIQWQKSLGGTQEDFAYSIQTTDDGGCVVAGKTSSDDGDVSGNHGDFDCWVVKLDATGAIQWQKALGGTGSDQATYVRTTPDGGYVAAGFSNSSDGDVSGNHGMEDFWVVKLDATGTLQWQKSLGGTGDDRALSVQPASDGGYIVVGGSNSDDGDVSGNHGDYDCWVVKLDATGAIQWQKALGGTNIDILSSVQSDADGGYVVAGLTYSNDDEVSGNHGDADYWVVKLDAAGAIQWQRPLGGTQYEEAWSIQITADDGYILAGSTESDDGDVSGNHGMRDYWIVKLAPHVPVNDFACSAVHIPANGTVHSGFTNANATVDSGEDALTPANSGADCLNTWCETSNAIHNSVWFRFEAPPTGAVEVSTCDIGGFNTQIAAYSAGDCADFDTHTLLAANDDGAGCSAFSSKMNVGGLTPGQTYHILVDGYDGEKGGFSIRITPIIISAAHDVAAASPLLTTYPNPAASRITVGLEAPHAIEGYTLNDLTGKAVLDVRLGQPVQQTEVELGKVAKGVYLLQVRSGERVFSEKIIVQ